MDALVLALAHGTAAAVEIDEPGAPEAAGVPRVALAAALAALHPAERAHAAALAPARRRDWVAGRLALRAAAARLGARCDDPLLADDRGAPVVPAGVLGSVSHKRGLAVALAAPADGARRVGVDVELLARVTRIDVAPRVLTDAELVALAGLDPAARARAVTTRFALKEAVYKAIDPFVRRYVGFREVEVWPDDAGAARVAAVPGADLPVAIEAAYVILGDLVVCTAAARRA